MEKTWPPWGHPLPTPPEKRVLLPPGHRTLPPPGLRTRLPPGRRTLHRQALIPPAPIHPNRACRRPGAPYMQQTVVPPAPQTIIVTSHQAPMVAIVDQCPDCEIGALHEQFTPFGILCAIFFFPNGLICCLMSRHKMCPVCGTVFHGH
eukprot:XP_003723915.1 PREDICTED: brain protein I3-like isoform X2 [Strongylocentrotus purpuratus]